MAKGDDFERDMCRYLSLWFTYHERDDIFWRNRLRKTIMSLDGKHQLGDVMAMDLVGVPFVGLFNVELKTGYSKTKKGKKVRNIPWDLLDLIDHASNKKGAFVIMDFWEQTRADAEMSKRMPMLIFSRDYHVPVVCVSYDVFSMIHGYAGSIFSKRLSLSFQGEGDLTETLAFYRADDFFGWLTPEIVKVMYNRKEE